MLKEIISKKELKEFGITFGLLFPFFVGWIIPLLSAHPFKVWTFWLAAPFLILGIIRPQILHGPYKLWMKLGFILGWINSRIILGMIFLIVLLPISIFMRIFGYDPLRKKKLKKYSYRETNHDHIVDLTRIF